MNSHATSPLVADEVEVRGLRLVFKSRANKLLITATKSLIGHTLGAAGALGAITSIMALQTGIVHPTLNLEDPDPECHLAGISGETQEGRLKVAMANAFGFGSNNGVLVLKRFVAR